MCEIASEGRRKSTRAGGIKKEAGGAGFYSEGCNISEHMRNSHETVQRKTERGELAKRIAGGGIIKDLLCRNALFVRVCWVYCVQSVFY